jgi:hypothetical protein
MIYSIEYWVEDNAFDQFLRLDILLEILSQSVADNRQLIYGCLLHFGTESPIEYPTLIFTMVSIISDLSVN